MNNPSPALLTFLQLNKFEIKIFLKEKKSDIGWDQFLLRKRIGTTLTRNLIIFPIEKMSFKLQIIILISLFSVFSISANVKYRRDLTMSSENRPKPVYSNHQQNDEHSRSSLEETEKGKAILLFFKLSRLVNKNLRLKMVDGMKCSKMI